MSNVVMPVYARLPVAFTKGQGPWLWDTEGNQYLDALSGIAVTLLGHNHPAITAAIVDQASKVLHTCNSYEITYQNELAKALCRVSGMSQAFFCNSGAEANEAAIKIARLYGHNKGIKTPNIIVMENSFHGRSLATLSASGNRKIQAGFEPLVQGFVRAPFNDFEALETIAENNPDIVAVMLEPILGNGGIAIPDHGYLKNIRRLCDENGWLMILDEVQTGIAHTGKMFAYQHEGIIPDVVALAKALGNGFPIGACLAHGKAVDIFSPGKHGTTLGGNPMACRVGLTVLETIEKENLLAHATKMGEYLLRGLTEILGQQKGVTAIRGKGMMFGVDIDRPGTGLTKLGLKHRLLFNVTNENTIRLLPAIIINQEEADQIIARLQACLKEFLA